MKTKKWLLIGIVLSAFYSAALFGQHTTQVVVSEFSAVQWRPQVAYNCNDDEYLAVWEDDRDGNRNIYGQIIEGDGTLRGGNFPIGRFATAQMRPHIDFDKVHNRYLVVFYDFRNGGNQTDIYGALLDSDGNKIVTATSESDTCFPICNNTAYQMYPAVAFNYLLQIYCVVWQDERTTPYPNIYSQVVEWDGTLLWNASDVNMPITTSTETGNWVPDIAYNGHIDEWMVVFSRGIAGSSSIWAQRLDNCQNWLKVDGSNYGEDPLCVTEETGWCPDNALPRIAPNDEPLMDLGKATSATLAEYMVVWRTRRLGDVDIYGQRIGFTGDDPPYTSTRLSISGEPGAPNYPNYPVCNAAYNQDMADITYGAADNEFMVGWGDERRTNSSSDQDFYCQRLYVDGSGQMNWLNEDRSGTVATDVNIPLATTDNFEGSYTTVGAAHGAARNEFFLVYVYKDDALATDYDIHGQIIPRSFTGVEDRPQDEMPASFHVSQNYPNPFNPKTTIHFGLPTNGRITVTVFDLTGKEIKKLADGIQSACPAG